MKLKITKFNEKYYNLDSSAWFDTRVCWSSGLAL